MLWGWASASVGAGELRILIMGEGRWLAECDPHSCQCADYLYPRLQLAEAAEQITMQMKREDAREALFSNQVRGMKCRRAGGARLLLMMGTRADCKDGRRRARLKCLVEV